MAHPHGRSQGKSTTTRQRAIAEVNGLHDARQKKELELGLIKTANRGQVRQQFENEVPGGRAEQRQANMDILEAVEHQETNSN